MSPAVMLAGPRTSRRSTTGSSDSDVSTMSLMFKMMSVASSVTPVMVSNSWRASSKRTVEIAAPGIDDSSVRRSEFPIVYPNPGSRGPIAKRWRVGVVLSSSIGSTVGRWMTSMNGLSGGRARVTWSRARR